VEEDKSENWRYWNDPYNLEALEKADDLYNKALEYDPAFGQAYLGLAQVYWDKNYIAEYLTENFMDSALVLANTALSYDKDLAEAYVLKGDYYSARGYNEQALEEYNKAIEINSSSWQAYRGRASLYINYVGSLDDFHKALSLGRGREQPNILVDMCWMTMSAGFLEIGQKYNQERLKLTNDSSVYYSLLGRSLFWLSNLEDALKYYQKAYMLDTMNIEVLYMVGILNGYVGQYEESLVFLKKWLGEKGMI
jgi:tetratricopeptide (TPR) repeat protein